MSNNLHKDCFGNIKFNKTELQTEVYRHKDAIKSHTPILGTLANKNKTKKKKIAIVLKKFEYMCCHREKEIIYGWFSKLHLHIKIG